MKEKKTRQSFVVKKIAITNLDAKERDGVEQEVMLLQAVHHPNIVGCE